MSLAYKRVHRPQRHPGVPGVIGFNVELGNELSVDGFDDLAHGVEESAHFGDELHFLVGSEQHVQARPEGPGF